MRCPLNNAALPKLAMNPRLETLIAAAGVFVGSLFWDVAFGDGIQSEDVFQAATVATVAASIQWLLAMARRGKR